MTEKKPSAAAMRAAVCWEVERHFSLTEELTIRLLGEIIDRETHLPELIEALEWISKSARAAANNQMIPQSGKIAWSSAGQVADAALPPKHAP